MGQSILSFEFLPSSHADRLLTLQEGLKRAVAAPVSVGAAGLGYEELAVLLLKAAISSTSSGEEFTWGNKQVIVVS